MDTAPMIATAIRATMRPYSIAVAPDSSAAKRHSQLDIRVTPIMIDGRVVIAAPPPSIAELSRTGLLFRYPDKYLMENVCFPLPWLNCKQNWQSAPLAWVDQARGGARPATASC